MILAILFSIIGLGVIATTLHRMTINALSVFAALTAGFAAHDGGIGIVETAMIAFAAGALAFGLFDALTQHTVHPALRYSARAMYTVPACIVAWFITLTFAKLGQVSQVTTILMALVAVALVARSA
jgi:hypothetical protein